MQPPDVFLVLGTLLPFWRPLPVAPILAPCSNSGTLLQFRSIVLSSTDGKEDVRTDISHVDSSCEEEKKNKEDKIGENGIEEDMMVEEMKAREDVKEDEEKKEKSEVSIYSRYTKRRRESLRENKPIST